MAAISNFKEGDKVSVWGDSLDVVIVSGFSKDFVDNQGSPLIEIESLQGKSEGAITPQALEKVEQKNVEFTLE